MGHSLMAAQPTTGGGFRRQRQTLLVELDGQLSGLWVRTRHASPAVMRHIVRAARQVEQPNRPLTDQADLILDLCEAFGGLIDAWNLQDEDGRPVPATAAALASEDVSFVLALVYGWFDALAARAHALRGTPSDLDPGELAEVPMEPVNG